ACHQPRLAFLPFLGRRSRWTTTGFALSPSFAANGTRQWPFPLNLGMAPHHGTIRRKLKYSASDLAGLRPRSLFVWTQSNRFNTDSHDFHLVVARKPGRRTSGRSAPYRRTAARASGPVSRLWIRARCATFGRVSGFAPV